MDYDSLTDRLLRKVLEEFNLIDIYQEFLDSIIVFNDFIDLDKENFRKYLDKIKI
ncbi:MAG: hypothetical protein ACP6IY_19570 [Promethearchaeia archaeon]